tara:strand:- start:526 stop:777 length:252 start_codon:yes stop_codon:yes gene_type:complete
MNRNTMIAARKEMTEDADTPAFNQQRAHGVNYTPRRKNMAPARINGPTFVTAAAGTGKQSSPLRSDAKHGCPTNGSHSGYDDR